MREGDLTRILLAGDTAGGVWTFVLELSAGLIERGYGVTLATFGPSVSDSQRVGASGIKGLRWLHHYSKLEWMEDPWDDIRHAGCWLQKIAEDERPDVIHLNTLCHGDLPWPVPVVTTVHSSVTAWWEAVKGSPIPSTWLRYEEEVRASLSASTVLTAPSRSALDDLRKHHNISTKNACPIYNGIRPEMFRRAEKENFIFSAGRIWDQAKNITALATIATELPWPVFLAGDVGEIDVNNTVLSQCQLLGQIAVADLAEWYSRAAIYAFPARYEPFGLSILEAAMSGCALVLGDIPSLREIWGDAAIFVDPDDVQALRGALENLIHHPNYRQEMSLLAGNRAVQFTQSRMVSEYVSAYQLAVEVEQTRNRRLACVS